MGSKASFWVLVATFLWKNLGYDIVLWLAGLAGVPISIQEAARVDGAGPFKIFWHVTLPNLLPTFYTVSVLSLLGAQKVFREAYLAAGEYPHESIYLLQHLFNHWFQELSIDKLSAAAVTMAFGILAVVIGLRKIKLPAFLFLSAAALTIWFPVLFLAGGSIMGNLELSTRLAPVFQKKEGFVFWHILPRFPTGEIGRASCRERV